jgi:hypothetical protein
MPAVNDVGEPCAGEPHARFDGRELETEHILVTATAVGHPDGKPQELEGCRAYHQDRPPRQFPTLQPGVGPKGSGPLACAGHCRPGHVEKVQ